MEQSVPGAAAGTAEPAREGKCPGYPPDLPPVPSGTPEPHISSQMQECPRRWDGSDSPELLGDIEDQSASESEGESTAGRGWGAEWDREPAVRGGLPPAARAGPGAVPVGSLGKPSSSPQGTAGLQQPLPLSPLGSLKDAGGWSRPGSRPPAQAAFWGQQLHEQVQTMSDGLGHLRMSLPAQALQDTGQGSTVPAVCPYPFVPLSLHASPALLIQQNCGCFPEAGTCWASELPGTG